MKAIARYKELGIDPSTKTIIFSNALTFGIGTNLTNDTGFKPSNIVMKLTSCRMNKNQPVFNCVKLSDAYGDKGWELVSVVYVELVGFIYYFKKELKV